MEYTPELIRAARAMRQRRVPVTEIASSLGMHRATIHRWLKKKESGRQRRSSKLDPYKDYIRSRLRDYSLPATVLIRELQELGYSGGITILKEYMHCIRDEFTRDVVDRFETEPGRQAQVDWGECGLIRHRGRQRKLHVFLMVLGYSRYTWAEFTTSTRRPELLRLMEKAFREIGGIPREVLVDNMKQVIDRCRRGGQSAVVNDSFEEFSRWSGFRVAACPPYWPRAKGKVERGVDYIKHSFLEGREFGCIDDLNGQLRGWLATVANVRKHGTVKERPVDRLPMDVAAMGALQPRSYPSLDRCSRTVGKDARISYGGVIYSVDPGIIRGRRTSVEVCRGSDDILRMYHAGVLVGQHLVMPSGSSPQDDPLHAALRRELAARPPERRPGKGPRFHQQDMPTVDERSLDVYEELIHACV
jgi:transposase